MTRRLLALAGFAAITCAGWCSDTPLRDDKFIVHEWGTFLTMSGSDGITLDGMYHEEHALPSFVHARSKDQLRIRSAGIKGETPVIYFYTNKPLQARVRVDFPQGVWTQWYPQASLIAPSLTELSNPLKPNGGRIHWNVDVYPPNQVPADARPPVTAKDALWNHARNVDAAFVRSSGAYGSDKGEREWERYIFYRGLGKANMPLTFSAEAGGKMSLSAECTKQITGIFVLRVEDGKASYRYISSLAPGKSLTGVIPDAENSVTIDEMKRKAGDEMAAYLQQSGLFAKEARAMVNTWRESYFGQEGIRALYILPQEWTEQFIPMQVSPKPDETVRVMVGRVELMTLEREKRAENAIRQLASTNLQTREKAFDALRKEGRYLEPVLRRAIKQTNDDSVRRIAKQLLLTDFVTELRGAVHAATDGSRTIEKPEAVKAQLALLLHESGMTEQAKSTGKDAIQQITSKPAPQIDNPSCREYYRSLARAYEAAGEPANALDTYEKFVEFGSQTKKCGGCHQLGGPKDMSFYRDWWAGERYARLAAETGSLTKRISTHEQQTKLNPGDTAARMMLAYLYAEKNQPVKSEASWALVAPECRQRSARR